MSKKTIPAKDSERLLKSLMMISRLVEQVLESRPIEVSDLPLTKSKVQVLRLLSQRGVHSVSQIAQHLGISRPAASQVLDNLERDALVKRSASKKDGRGVDISLTQKGRGAAKAVAKEQTQLVRTVIRDVGARKAEDWAGTLEKITAAIAQAHQEFRQFCLQCGAYSDASCVLVGGDCDCPYLQAKTESGEQSPKS
ncbi:MAG: MarR family winged helix-turn-helix transcriptional regulator [Planctomycetota bacterium]|jgi:DNA-binding MarR family transcriptional regulator